MNQVENIPESLLISFFITGLKPAIRRELSISRPDSLMEVFALAQAYEARLAETRTEFQPWSRPPARGPYTTFPPATPASVSPALALLPSIAPRARPSPLQITPIQTQAPLLSTPTALPVRHFTAAELRQKREQGLCYNCDAKWSRSHRCQSKFYLLLGTDDLEEDDPLQSPTADTPDFDLSDDPLLGDISSLHTLTGLGKPRSLLLTGNCGSSTFSVLVDNGSTHNFIQPCLVETLQLSTTAIPPFRVYIDNGDYLLCQRTCPAVPLVLQGHPFTVDLHILSIEGPSVILGIQWLQTLGKVSHDYANITMEFIWHEKPVKLWGQPSPSPHPISFHHLQALFHTLDFDSIFEIHYFPTISQHSSLHMLTDTATPFSDISPAVQQLLSSYSSLFSPPTGLPPFRTIDHRIHLLPNTAPINVRPYRYPQLQKQEMLKLVSEMLPKA